MKNLSKKIKNNRQHIKTNKIYPVKEGIKLLKNLQLAKFNESIDAAFHININTKKSEQNIRGSILLPYGTGKKSKIAVFATGKNAEIAKMLNVDAVGTEELADIIKKNKTKFDVVIASPDTMNIVSKLGPILGPRGIMPNPKFGTVTENIEKSIQEAKIGKINYRNDKNGIIHSSFGKINFSTTQLYQNLKILFNAIKKSKPNQLKGIYCKKISLSSTMGPGIIIDHLSL
ncbi:50S ribosomal protein L1 [Buchnera aphidicola (Cinara tujafilina)]|uniref:Large ribosomal subunit protein uL1 n=1 Tax=Buchnera aphidicola (Cinara tujafilina) TaxID=261317 RepID=F7WYX1_9GAMM|nr:50S ribosomal protein L1 [Buchnera aphidicola]AEH39621.1 50S ribosomal protein L1 [Buchnera aphidicola (Cinara tujafilina)]